MSIARLTPLLVFTMFSLIGESGRAIGAAKSASRAVWVWEADTESMVLDAVAADHALEVARAEGITAYYLYADSFSGRTLIVEHAQRWQQLLRKFHAAGLQVHALLGSAYLHTEAYVLPERRSEAIAMVQRVLAFNASAPADSRFDAIHFDIEPHQLDEWDKNREGLLKAYLDMCQAFMELKRGAASVTPVGADIPFWLDGIPLDWNGQTKSVAEHVIQTLDFVTLMDYRNRAEGGDGIISHAQTELELAQKLGRRVVIGLETGEGELPKVTFRHLSKVEMEKAMAATVDAFQDNPAFAGFAIHHYATWNAWLRRNAPSGESGPR